MSARPVAAYAADMPAPTRLLARIPPIEAARRAAGEAVRSRVAGPDAVERARRIWLTPGPRWYEVDEPVSRVHGAPSMYAGGVAALLLQSLHPGAMAGVAGHSGFRGDPWGRLQRTSEYIATTSFGTAEHAERVVARIRGIHRRVSGTDHRGRPYRADDPHLLRWVHIAEILAFYSAYQAYSGTPLTRAEADAYVARSNVPAAKLGATGLPTTLDELRACIQAYRPELEASPAALDAAAFLLREPPLPQPARTGYAAIALAGVAILPPWARRELGLRLPEAAAPAARALGRATTAAVAWALRDITPRRNPATE